MMKIVHNGVISKDNIFDFKCPDTVSIQKQ